MQIEIYNMTVLNDKLNISLEAVCDSFSSLLWDIEYYKCGTFEVYIAAAIVYWIVCIIIEVASKLIEKRIDVKRKGIKEGGKKNA